MRKENPKTPKWFNLNKYAFLENLPSRLLCHELYIRQQQWYGTNGTLNEDATVEERMGFLIWIKSSINDAREYGQAHFLDYELAKHLRTELNDYSQLENFFGESTPVNTLNLAPTSPNKQRKPACRLTFADLHSNFLIPKPIADIFDKNIHELKQFFYELHLICNLNIFESFEDVLAEMGSEGKDSFNKTLDLINQLDANSLKDEMVLPKPKEFDGSIEEYFDKVNYILSKSNLESIKFGNTKEEYIKVDLTATDQTVLDDTEEIIKHARQIKNIESTEGIIETKPEDKSKGGIKILKSMIEQRIIPYIDLLLWEKENNFDLSDEWFMKRIFADKKAKKIEIQPNKIYTTVKPLTKKCLNSSWLNSFYSFDLNSYKDYFPRG